MFGVKFGWNLFKVLDKLRMKFYSRYWKIGDFKFFNELKIKNNKYKK